MTDKPKTLTIGDKVYLIDRWEIINGQEVPIIKVKAEEVPRPDGGQDVIVHVPCLKLNTQLQKGAN